MTMKKVKQGVCAQRTRSSERVVLAFLSISKNLFKIHYVNQYFESHLNKHRFLYVFTFEQFLLSCTQSRE